jgi:hypothetical protein
MIKILDRSKGNVFGLEVTGKITAEDIEKVAAQLKESIDKYGKINWVFIFRDFKGATIKGIYEDIKFALGNLKHFDKMAVVGDKLWLELLIKADGLIFGEKYFDISKLEDAWKYIEG